MHSFMETKQVTPLFSVTLSRLQQERVICENERVIKSISYNSKRRTIQENNSILILALPIVILLILYFYLDLARNNFFPVSLNFYDGRKKSIKKFSSALKKLSFVRKKTCSADKNLSCI